MDSSKHLGLGMLDWIDICYKKTSRKELETTIFKVEDIKLLIVVVYVNDIIFGGSNGLCKEFAKEM